MMRIDRNRTTWWERAAVTPLIALFVMGLAYLATPLPELMPPPAPVNPTTGS